MLLHITQVLSRTFKRVIVREFNCPAIFELSCTDQHAFRPTGSTTGAHVTILQSLTELLLFDSYVVVIMLDFSKALDIVRHFALLHQMATMNIFNGVYNWLVDFFSGYSHSLYKVS